MIPKAAIKEWAKSFTTQNWKGAWTKEESTRAFFNVRNFLRSLYLQINTEGELTKKAELEKLIIDAIQNLRPY